MSQEVLSETMLRRDNFFHSCWMELKHLRPDLCEVMTKVELTISGYTEKPEDSNDEQSDTHNIL